MNKLILIILAIFLILNIRSNAQDPNPLPSISVKRLISPNDAKLYYDQADSLVKMYKGAYEWTWLIGKSYSDRYLVPYDGANRDVHLNTHSIATSGVKFNTVNPLIVSNAGEIGWDAADGTLDLRLLNNTTLQMGQESYFYGKAIEPITNGDPVMIAGVQGNHLTFKKAIYSELANYPQKFLGIATQNIATNAFGYVTWFGKVHDTFTTGWSAGDNLYFDPITNLVTNVLPNAPYVVIRIGSVIELATGAAENGTIGVRPTFGIRLQDLNDVNGTPLTTKGQFPVWDQANQYFDFDYNIWPDLISNEAYSGSWNGIDSISPSKNAVYDKISTLESINYCAATMTVTTGTLNQGTVADLCAVGETDVIIQERVASPPFQIDFTFTGVIRLSGLKFYGRYNGGATHNVHVECYNYVSATWDYVGELSTTVNKQWFAYNLNLPNNYLSGGNVQVRIIHQDTGINTHQMILDYINVNYGGGGGSGFITAGAVEFTPNGNITDTNVQAAIQKLDAIKENLSSKENITVDNSTTKYPTVNLLKTYADTKEPLLVKGTITESVDGLVLSDSTRQAIGGAVNLSLKNGYLIPTTTSAMAWNAEVASVETLQSITDNGNSTTNKINSNDGFSLSSLNYQITYTSPLLSTDQGYSFDGVNHYAFGTYWIYKYDSNFNRTVMNNNSILGISGVNHMGDGVYLNGYLYCPVETYPAVTGMKIAKYDANTLLLMETYDISAQNHECSSIATDGIYLYISSYNDGTKIWKYSLTGSYVGYIAIETPFANNIQGISYYSDHFYISEQTKVSKINADGTNRVELFTDYNPFSFSHIGGGIHVVHGEIRILLNDLSNGISNIFYYNSLATGGTRVFDVDSSGKTLIGTGTSTSSAKLQIQGDARINTTSGGNFIKADGTFIDKNNGRQSSYEFPIVSSESQGTKRFDLITSSYTDIYKPGDGFLETYFWDNAGRFDFQVWYPSSTGSTTGIKYRGKNNGASFPDWTKLWDSGNSNLPTVNWAANNITATNTISATTALLYNLNNVTIPYHINDASGLGNTNMAFDGTRYNIASSGAPGTSRLGIKQSGSQIFGGLWIESSSNTNAIAIGHSGTIGYIGTNYTGSGVDTPIEIRTTSGANYIYLNTTGNALIGTRTDNNVDKLQVNGSIKASSSVTANSFIKIGGTSAQYLLADGSTTSVAGSVYKGELNGLTGAPISGGSVLADGTGTVGWYYATGVAGTHNYGSGSITLDVGDQLYYNGTIWLRIPGASSYTLPVATASILGGVKSSSSVSIDASGIASVSTAYEYPLTFSTGLSRVGNTVSSTITQYTDAMASSSIYSTLVGTATRITTASADGTLGAIADGTNGQVLQTNGSGGYSWVDQSGITIDTLFTTIAISDETTSLTIGTSKVTFRMPISCTLTKVRASVTTASTGANLIFDINENGTSVLSTKLIIDATEKVSVTASSQPVISDSSILDYSEITIDIDQVGSTIAGIGAKIIIYYIKN